MVYSYIIIKCHFYTFIQNNGNQLMKSLIFTTLKIRISKTQLFNGIRAWIRLLHWFESLWNVHDFYIDINSEQINSARTSNHWKRRNISDILRRGCAKSFVQNETFIVWSFVEIIILIEEEYHGCFFCMRMSPRYDAWSKSIYRLKLLERNLEQTRSSETNDRTPVFIILFYSSIDYHPGCFTSIT